MPLLLPAAVAVAADPRATLEAGPRFSWAATARHAAQQARLHADAEQMHIRRANGTGAGVRLRTLAHLCAIHGLRASCAECCAVAATHSRSRLIAGQGQKRAPAPWRAGASLQESSPKGATRRRSGFATTIGAETQGAGQQPTPSASVELSRD